MRKKFETNVAQEMPKTKAGEPDLPWKLKNEDMEQFGQASDEYRKPTAPLRTRGIFLVTLVVAIFGVISYLIFAIISENEEIRTGVLQKEGETSAIKAELEKMRDEKKSLTENAAQLERKVNDLSAQKELFTSVIETLTKKADEIEMDADEGASATAGKKEAQKSLAGKGR